MARGVVVEKDNGYAVVLTAEGEFRYLKGRRARTAEVGGLVEVPDGALSRWWVAAAASLLILLVATWQLGMISPAAAYLSVDLGPTVELALDRQGRIIKARGLGPEGKQLVHQLTLEGVPVEQGLVMLLQYAVSDPSTREPVVIGFTRVPGRGSVVDAERVADWAAEARAAVGRSHDVVVVPVSVFQRGKAVLAGESPGHYVLMRKMTARTRAAGQEDTGRYGEGGTAPEGGRRVREGTGAGKVPAPGAAGMEDEGAPATGRPAGQDGGAGKLPGPDAGGLAEERLQELAGEREIILLPGHREGGPHPADRGIKPGKDLEKPDTKGPPRGRDTQGQGATPRGGRQGAAPSGD